MILDATTKSIEAYLGGAPATNQLPVVTFYFDHTATALTPGEYDTVTNGTTAVAIVQAPATLTQRQVKLINIYNADTASVTVYICLNNNSTTRILKQTTLQPGETLIYQQEGGWQVLDVYGFIKQGGSFVRMAPLVKGPIIDAANLTAVTAFASGTCHCYYMGVAPYASSSVNLLVNVTTAIATITWAEIAIYKGTPMLNAACPDLRRLGWTDVAAIYNATGIKNTNIVLATPLNPGDHIWVVLGSNATTPFQIRGALADNIQTGLFQTLAQRPSIAPGPIASAIAGASVVPGWIAIRVN